MDDKGFIMKQKTQLYEYQQNKTPKSSWSADIRKKAFEKYSTMSWPTPSDESWRRTDITGIDVTGYNPFSIEKSHSVESPPAVYIVSLENIFFSSHEHFFKFGLPFIQKRISESQDIFTLFNFSFLNSGYFIYIPDNTILTEPIIIDYHFLGSHSLASPQTIIVAGENSSGEIDIIHHINDGNIYNSNVNLYVSDNTALQVNTVQNISKASMYFSNIHAEIFRDSRIELFESHTGSSLAKTNTTVALSGTGSEARLYGLYYGVENQHFDIGTTQVHAAKNTNSRSYYKGAASGSSRTVYQGLIEVAKNAEKTDAYLTNKNLILGDASRSDSIPSLKIKNNDVKCSHGSTTGKLNKDQMFYLMSRGISENDAKELLIQAFFEDILNTASDLTRDTIRTIIKKRTEYAGMEKSYLK